MLKFCVNLNFMFTEVNFLDRFERASRAGFKAVEVHFPYEWKKEELADRLDRYGLQMIMYVMPPGDWTAGEQGIACFPERVGEFQESVGLAIEYAKALRCSLLNCLVGLTPKDVPAEKARQTIVENFRFAATATEKEGIRLMVAPLSDQDSPGYPLLHTRDALQLIEEVNHPNLWLQYDVYHMQTMEGNLTKTIADNLAHIKYIQIADNPGRHEPGTGEINFTNLLRFIDEAGYDGWVGCEYKPLGVTEASLGWIRPYLEKGGE